MKIGEKRAHFHVLCDRPILHGKTTAISKSPFYWMQKLMLYLRAPTIFGKCARYDEK